MMRAIVDEVDPAGFESRLKECSESLQELVAYLRASARYAGRAVAARRFRHSPPNSGWGVTYYNGGAPFCEVHPKIQDGHAWVLLHGADIAAVLAAGFEPSKQSGCFKIRDMGEAVRVVHWILQSHDSRTQPEQPET